MIMPFPTRNQQSDIFLDVLKCCLMFSYVGLTLYTRHQVFVSWRGRKSNPQPGMEETTQFMGTYGFVRRIQEL